ncbi:MAG TPA: ATP-binding protein, partial [Trebonia sp.]|nr:ATP-binding protein [Trebonia sp.]
MTMLSLSRRLGITPRPDHDEYDPAAAGWLDSGRPEGARQEAVHQAFVPQQWAGTSAVRDRERANHAAVGHAADGHRGTARGPHPLGLAEPEAAPPWAPGPAFPAGPANTQPIKRRQASARPDGAWPEICDQFGSHLLVLAEQVRASLNVLEAGEDDPERLKRLYQVDHAVTRMRLASRQLRTLAGRDDERLAGFTTSLLDLIRMASSAIEWYAEVSVGPVVDLAVPGYAADDIATLLSALLDNATKYSASTVTVSCHLLQEGGVMFRIEDTGMGIGRDKVRRLNAAFAGAVPDVEESTSRHVGFPVVHRIASKHSIGVRFASRRPPATGTLAMVILPPQLLCAIPAQPAPCPPAAAEPPAVGEPPAAAEWTVAAEWTAAAEWTVAAEPVAPPTEAGPLPPLPRRAPSGPVETVSAEIVSAQTVSGPAASVQAARPAATPSAVSVESASFAAPPAEAQSPATVSFAAAALQAAVLEVVALAAPILEATAPEAVSPEATAPEAVPPEATAPAAAPAQTVSPPAMSAEPGQEARPRRLPRRERASLRGDEPRPAEAAPPPSSSPPPQTAARMAFAD